MNDTKVIKLLGDNRSDPPFKGRFGQVPGASLSGGAWVLPLVNLQDPELGLIARSRSASTADARFTVTFTRMTALRAFFLGNTNLTLTSQVRLTGYYDVNRTDVAFDETFDAYPSVGFTEELEWEAENSWDGKPEAADLEGNTQNAFTVFDDVVRCMALDVQILDEGNPDGFISLGRLLSLNGWAVARNYSYGGSLALGTDTAIEKSMSGAEYADPREVYRIYNIAFPYLEEQNALAGLEMVRRTGTHGEILVIDDSDPKTLHKLSFLARPLVMPAWTRSAPNLADIEFQLKERLP